MVRLRQRRPLLPTRSRRTSGWLAHSSFLLARSLSRSKSVATSPAVEAGGRGERQDRPRGTSSTCADGLRRRHSKGRPGSHTVCTLGARKPATPGADVRALRHSRSHRVGGEQSLWHPDPEPLDLVHEQRVDHVRFRPRRGGDLLMINDVAAPSATPAPSPVRSDSPAQCPARSVEGRNQSRPDWFRSGTPR